MSDVIPCYGLAAWQAKRVRLYIETNLAKRLHITELADAVNLSASHFCRAFKRTFGVTAHLYVMRRRVVRAQRLMLTSVEALSSIAVSCGMSDQSHLTRWFARVVGETPAAWRRARFEPKRALSFTDESDTMIQSTPVQRSALVCGVPGARAGR